MVGVLGDLYRKCPTLLVDSKLLIDRASQHAHMHTHTYTCMHTRNTLKDSLIFEQSIQARRFRGELLYELGYAPYPGSLV